MSVMVTLTIEVEDEERQSGEVTDEEIEEILAILDGDNRLGLPVLYKIETVNQALRTYEGSGATVKEIHSSAVRRGSSAFLDSDDDNENREVRSILRLLESLELAKEDNRWWEPI